MRLKLCHEADANLDEFLTCECDRGEWSPTSSEKECRGSPGVVLELVVEMRLLGTLEEQSTPKAVITPMTCANTWKGMNQYRNEQVKGSKSTSWKKGNSVEFMLDLRLLQQRL
jgi:hypothetical protein